MELRICYLTKLSFEWQCTRKIFLVIHGLGWPAIKDPYWRYFLKRLFGQELNSSVNVRYIRCKGDKKKSWQRYLLFASLFLLIGSQGGKKGPITTWINLGSKFRVEKKNLRRFWCSAIIFQVWKQAKVKKKHPYT